MIVYYIQNDAEPVCVRRVDERAEVVRPAVVAIRREHPDAVVAPAEVAGEVADRHELDERDAELSEAR